MEQEYTENVDNWLSTSIFNEHRYGFVVGAIVTSQILAGQLSFSLSRRVRDYVGARAECIH